MESRLSVCDKFVIPYLVQNHRILLQFATSPHIWYSVFTIHTCIIGDSYTVPRYMKSLFLLGG